MRFYDLLCSYSIVTIVTTLEIPLCQKSNYGCNRSLLWIFLSTAGYHRVQYVLKENSISKIANYLIILRYLFSNSSYYLYSNND